ncbi:hypothetical protein ACFVAV_21550 [Nocardia sp. NPDC057663]|uniref:hypothetical protein n=1 Tax=Nocardia sp. NPDC057663 TaxID=3346201 RepID=UPI0036707182
MDRIPEYIFELVDFKGPLADVVLIVGFSTDTPELLAIEPAVYGIAYVRGVDVYDSPLTRTTAEEALRNRSDVLDEFRATFPFISAFPEP